MQRYLETLLRRKWLFIAPALVIPLLTVAIAFLSGRQFVVGASLWVQPTQLLLSEAGSSSSKAPNTIESQVIQDRLATEDFRVQIMHRSGLTDSIIAEEWPNPTRLQNIIVGNEYLKTIGRVFGIAPPETQSESFAYALRMIGSSIKVRIVGDNVVVIFYQGGEPEIGQRLIEETIRLHGEERIASQIRETEVGVEYLSRQLETLQGRLAISTENLLRFEEDFPAPPLGLQRPADEVEQLQQLRQNQQLDQSLYLDTLNRLESLRIRSDASISSADLVIEVIDEPVAGSSNATISPRKLAMMGMMGVTIGSIFTSVLVVIITWRDNIVRTSTDVRRMLGSVTIIEIPDIEVSKNRRPNVLRIAAGLARRSG